VSYMGVSATRSSEQLPPSLAAWSRRVLYVCFFFFFGSSKLRM